MENSPTDDDTVGTFGTYFQSKLVNILFTRGLAKRLLATGVTANSIHPGVIVSELQRFAFLMKICLAPLILFMKTAKSGAQTIIALSVDPELEQVSGRYFKDCRIVDECELARDDETADWLWQTSEQLTPMAWKMLCKAFEVEELRRKKKNEIPKQKQWHKKKTFEIKYG